MDFTGDTIYVEYNCIRNIEYLFMKFLQKNKDIQEALKDYIAFDVINKTPDNEFYRISLIRRHRNMLRCLPLYRKDFDIDKSYDSILNDNIDEILLCEDSEYGYHSLFYGLNSLRQVRYVNNIIIRIPQFENNKAIGNDLLRVYGESPDIKFIIGDFETIAPNILPKATMVIVDYYKKLEFMKNNISLKNKEIMLPSYYFNLKPDEIFACKVNMEDVDCKFGIYSPRNKKVKGVIL